jgi:hypothetical protein
MLRIHIPDIEYYDDEKEEFGQFHAQDITLEHSLVSLSKWESKWHKPYLEDNEKTKEEALDYIRCMTLTQNVNPEIYNYLPQEIIDQIVEYIEDPMTATWFGQRAKKPQKMAVRGRRHTEILTSEVLYYYMIQLQIPFECQKWHLNRLLTLIRVCSEKNNPKKMSRQDQMAQQRLLNAQRRAKMHSKG